MSVPGIYRLAKAPEGGILQPGQWRGGGKHVIVRCPKCELVAGLDHKVSASGEVTPSLQCPSAECSFHEMVVLENWNG